MKFSISKVNLSDFILMAWDNGIDLRLNSSRQEIMVCSGPRINETIHVSEEMRPEDLISYLSKWIY